MSAASKDSGRDILDQTVAAFRNPRVAKLHPTALRKYAVFCSNRTAELYRKFLTLVGDEDQAWLDDAVFTTSFRACAPFAGKKHERDVSGMAKGRSPVMHGLVRYEYKGHVVEECRKDGRQHGLRVVCTEMGHVWLRFYENGNRLAQLVLNGDMSEQSSVDEGGLKVLKSNLDLVRKCFESHKM